jgi:two-component system NarL family sensor kinase
MAQNWLALKIHDDGKGFDYSDTEKFGIGLNNLQERVDYYQGKIAIHSNNEGTRIEIKIPLSSFAKNFATIDQHTDEPHTMGKPS